jgi:hypothetical protein
LYNLGHVNSPRQQFSMGNLIPHRVILHNLGPRTSLPTAPIEDECRTVLEPET